MLSKLEGAAVMNLAGIYPPITTPFNGDGDVDFDALRRNIDRYITTPVAGMVVLGTNGEAPLLSESEGDRVIEVARDAVPRDRTLIAGTGRDSTRAAIQAVHRAAGLGVDAVLVRTPSSYRSQMDARALIAHYEAIADGSVVPVILYNFTAATGVNLGPEIVARLADHPNIVGVKDSNGDTTQIAELVRTCSGRLSVLVGSAQTFYASLCLGASGGILAVACIAPQACARLLSFVSAGRHADALALQFRLLPLARCVTTKYGVPGLKVAMDAAGWIGGPPRPPLLPLRGDEAEEVRRATCDFLASEPQPSPLG